MSVIYALNGNQDPAPSLKGKLTVLIVKFGYAIRFTLIAQKFSIRFSDF